MLLQLQDNPSASCGMAERRGVWNFDGLQPQIEKQPGKGPQIQGGRSLPCHQGTASRVCLSMVIRRTLLLLKVSWFG